MAETLTRKEIQAKLEEIHKKRTDLMDKYGLFGGGEEINKLFSQLNLDYRNYEALLAMTKEEEEGLKFRTFEENEAIKKANPNINSNHNIPN